MWPNRQETADLVTFTEEILNGKLHFLCNVVTSTSIGTTSACITSSKTFILLITSAASSMTTMFWFNSTNLLHSAAQFYRRHWYPDTSLRNRALTKLSNDWLVNFVKLSRILIFFITNEKSSTLNITVQN